VIPERLINDCELPELVPLLPQVIAEPMFVKVVPLVEYCHWPVVGLELERRTLYAAISDRDSSKPALAFTVNLTN
jgi:hypothetical protein